MALQADYAERVYAGVLGKIIGVYLGRPFEGWPIEMIDEHLGEINYYVHDMLDVPLVVTDDDISGTFTFVRAMEDYHFKQDLSARDIGRTWLNYLIEERTVLWWGGLGNSTEHTAYLRLKSGIDGPDSGSIETNGQVVAEQIGSQIFIDGWALIYPGDPERAARLAAEASMVSHGGEAVYGAQVVAAMEAQAFVENDLNKLIDTAVSFIPGDSVIYRMIDELREWHQKEPDWRKGRELIAGKYGYDQYGGNCHMVPNHALIIHALLHGDDDFQKSLMIVNTCGWDTDCNSGNVGCLLGIKNGLAGIEESGPDWRGPVADRILLPTADGGNAVTDAVTQTTRLVNMGARLAGEEPPVYKNGARYHFSFPGSVQGFQEDPARDSVGVSTVRNIRGHSESGDRSLAIRFRGMGLGKNSRVDTDVFVPDRETHEYFANRGYALYASPALYAGQTVKARLEACPHNGGNLMACLYVKVFGKDDNLEIVRSDCVELQPGGMHVFEWTIPDTGGSPVAKVGLELCSDRALNGYAFLDYLTWDGVPNTTFRIPDVFTRKNRFQQSGIMWKHAWVNGVDHYERFYPETFRIIHNEGMGLLMTGCREWDGYQVQADVTPHMVKSCGVGVNVHGMKRYVGFLLTADGKARLVHAFDGDEQVLAETDYPVVFGQTYDVAVSTKDGRVACSVDGAEVLSGDVPDQGLRSGGVALLIEEGRTATQQVRIQPA